MKTLGRKGNWNEIAGTPKHRFANPIDKDLKNGKEKEVLGNLAQKPGQTRNRPPKIERREK